ncbi:MAG: endonuclease/exonuclease/phosphatase family protein [Pseudomonadota bacterium]
MDRERFMDQREQHKRPGTHQFGRVITTGVIGLWLPTLLSFLPYDLWPLTLWPLPLLVHFLPHVLWLGAGLAVLALLLKRPVNSAVAVGACLVCLVQITAVGARPASIVSVAMQNVPTFRIAHANLLGREVALRRFAEQVGDQRPHIIALTELPDSDGARLAKSTFEDYPYTRLSEANRASRTLLLSKYPFTERRAPRRSHPYAAEALINLPGTETRSPQIIRIITIHPDAPLTPQRTRNRNRVINEIFTSIDVRAENALPTLIIGDLNATPWSNALRQMAHQSGLERLTSLNILEQMSGTWVSTVPGIGIPIDHAYATPDLSATRYQISSATGSDHFPILLEIAFYGGER